MLTIGISSHGGAPMMITMLIVFTIGDQNFERTAMRSDGDDAGAKG